MPKTSKFNAKEKKAVKKFLVKAKNEELDQDWEKVARYNSEGLEDKQSSLVDWIYHLEQYVSRHCPPNDGFCYQLGDPRLAEMRKTNAIVDDVLTLVEELGCRSIVDERYLQI